MLTFDVLRRANILRQPLFKNRKGELAHSDDWSPNDWFTAIAGELGEAANILKKVRRGDFSLDEVRPELAKELADAQVYLDILALRCGIDLGQATMDKWNEVSERIGIPLRIKKGLYGPIVSDHHTPYDLTKEVQAYHDHDSRNPYSGG